MIFITSLFWTKIWRRHSASCPSAASPYRMARFNVCVVLALTVFLTMIGLVSASNSSATTTAKAGGVISGSTNLGGVVAITIAGVSLLFPALATAFRNP